MLSDLWIVKPLKVSLYSRYFMHRHCIYFVFFLLYEKLVYLLSFYTHYNLLWFLNDSWIYRITDLANLFIFLSSLGHRRIFRHVLIRLWGVGDLLSVLCLLLLGIMSLNSKFNSFVKYLSSLINNMISALLRYYLIKRSPLEFGAWH